MAVIIFFTWAWLALITGETAPKNREYSSALVLIGGILMAAAAYSTDQAIAALQEEIKVLKQKPTDRVFTTEWAENWRKQG